MRSMRALDAKLLYKAQFKLRGMAVHSQKYPGLRIPVLSLLIYAAFAEAAPGTVTGHSELDQAAFERLAFGDSHPTYASSEVAPGRSGGAPAPVYRTLSQAAAAGVNPLASSVRIARTSQDRAPTRSMGPVVFASFGLFTALTVACALALSGRKRPVGPESP